MEAEAHRPGTKRSGDAGEVVARPAAGVEHTPVAARRHGPRVLQSLSDFRGDEVEMAGVEKRAAVPQLRGAVSTSGGTPPASGQQVDVAFAREVEAVPVTAGERAAACVEAEPADRTAQQPMSGTGRKRCHDAAPPG
jgi:hypothetical protein